MSEILELESVRQTGRQKRLQEQPRLHSVSKDHFYCSVVRVLAALAEDPGSVPTTTWVAHNHLMQANKTLVNIK